MTEQQAKRRSPLVLIILLLLGLAVAGYVFWTQQQVTGEPASPQAALVPAGANLPVEATPGAVEPANAAEPGADVAPGVSAPPAEAETSVAREDPAAPQTDTQAAGAVVTEAPAPVVDTPAAETPAATAPVEDAASAHDTAISDAADDIATELAQTAPDADVIAPAPATAGAAPETIEPTPEVNAAQPQAPVEPDEPAAAEVTTAEPQPEIVAPAPQVVESIGDVVINPDASPAPVAPQGVTSPEIAALNAPALDVLPQAEIPPAASDNNDDQISGLASDGTVPRFDVVRIDANGGIVVAGRAAPDSTVTVRLGGEAIGEARVDGNGQFVAIINAPASEAPQALQLESVLPEQASIAAAEEFIVLPAPVGAADSTPALVRASPESVELVQPFIGEVNAVSLDTISYSTVGAVVLNGRAQPGTAIRAYADQSLLGETVVGETGQWRLDVPGLDAGVYTLRIDEIDATGAVTSRVESPFQRETPEAAAAQALAAQAGGQVIVQPGNTLWLMATQAYGEGLLYTQIFAANSGAIRDPDLIYPGQVFAIPVLP